MPARARSLAFSGWDSPLHAQRALPIRNSPAPTTTTPVARATRSAAGARRSMVIAAATAAITRRSMIPMTRRIAIRPTQQRLQWRPRRRPYRQAVPGSAGSAPRPPPAGGELTRLPRGELVGARDQHHHADRDRHRTRQRRLVHRERRQRDAQREGSHPEQGPDEEVTPADHRDQPAPADRLAVAPQHEGQGRQHHRHHHHDPHAEERSREAGPRLSGHPHPRHRHGPAAGHRHPAHRRHGRAPADRGHRAGDEEQRRDPEKRHDSAQPLPYSSWRRNQRPVSLRPLGARSSHWYMPQSPSSPRANAE